MEGINLEITLYMLLQRDMGMKLSNVCGLYNFEMRDMNVALKGARNCHKVLEYSIVCKWSSPKK